MALLPVVIGENAAEDTQAIATELARMLGRISKSEFRVETGDGSRGIVVGVAADFPALPVSPDFGNGVFEREDLRVSKRIRSSSRK